MRPTHPEKPKTQLSTGCTYSTVIACSDTAQGGHTTGEDGNWIDWDAPPPPLLDVFPGITLVSLFTRADACRLHDPFGSAVCKGNTTRHAGRQTPCLIEKHCVVHTPPAK